MIVWSEAYGLIKAAGDGAHGYDAHARTEGVGDGFFAYYLRISGTVDTNSSDTFPPSFMVAATAAGTPSA